MSKLNDLIKELCPDGVEYKKLNEISEMKRGTSVTKKDIIEGDIPVISGGREPAYYCDTFNRDGETITVAGSGAGAGYVQYWTVPIFVCDAFSIKGKDCVKTKYLYYYLSNMQEYIYSTKKGGGVPHVHISSIDNMKIPIPPLPVQCEIVRILDNFTALTSALTSALTAELTAQRKRYSGLLNSLLSYEGRSTQDGVLWEKLGDICSVITKGTTPPQFTETGISFVKTEAFDGSRIAVEKLSYIDEDIHTHLLKRSILEEDDILITIAGATIGKCAMVPKEILPANTNQALAIVRLKHENLAKYVMYILQSDLMKKYMQQNIKGSAQPNLNLRQLNDFSIPIPSLEEQQRIVDILDRFDKLCNDLSEGLPAEIAARQKQYEYYRDKLLTFNEKKA